MKGKDRNNEEVGSQRAFKFILNELKWDVLYSFSGNNHHDGG